MSENLNLVRSICSAWDRGDYSAVEWEHPEIEFVITDGPTPGSWVGAAGIREGWGGFLSAFEGFQGKADEYRELDSERVFVLFHFGGRGKTSGVELGQTGSRAASLFHIRDDKVVKLVIYFDMDRVLADLGLKE